MEIILKYLTTWMLVVSAFVSGCGGAKHDDGGVRASPGDLPVILKEVDAEMEVLEDDLVNFYVQFLAYPPVTVKVYKGDELVAERTDDDNLPVPTTWGQSIAYQASVDDSGDYHLVISNDNGEVESEVFSLTVMERTDPDNAVIATAEQAAWVAGVYNGSRMSGELTDESYYYVGADGIISTYNYLGDAVNAGPNCYRAAQEGEINSGMEEKVLYWREDARELVARVGYGGQAGSVDVRFRLDLADELTQICVGTICSGSISYGLPKGIVISKAKLVSPMISDIESAVCVD